MVGFEARRLRYWHRLPELGSEEEMEIAEGIGMAQEDREDTMAAENDTRAVLAAEEYRERIRQRARFDARLRARGFPVNPRLSDQYDAPTGQE